MLADAKKRKIYDEGGEDALKSGGDGAGFHNPFDIFDMFFGGHTRSDSRGRRGKDMFHQLKVKFSLIIRHKNIITGTSLLKASSH